MTHNQPDRVVWNSGNEKLEDWNNTMNINAEELAERIEDKQDRIKDGAPVRMASVLIVDDEPGIRSFLQKGLRKYFGLVE
ncbi:MAG: hypothetical protein AB2805_01910, partial [Candidatus Thiodiazotropha sp.]